MLAKLSPYIKVLATLLIINIVIVMANSSFSKDKEKANPGKKLFKSNCAGCHAGGENLIKPDKPVTGSKILKSKAIFKKYLEDPPQPMPSFENITSKDEKLDELYAYVKTLMGK